MKTKLAFIIIFLAFGATPLCAQSHTVKTNIKVSGNCIMCKKRIETALDFAGVKVAHWDVKTKNLEVVYNDRKVSEQQIHELIAASGHDTERVKAKDEVYAKLPFCCLYRDRDHSNVKDEHHDHR